MDRGVEILVGAATDRGIVREANEDSLLWGVVRDGVIEAPEGGRFPAEQPFVGIVADGMGGTVGGKTASTMVVQTMAEVIRESWGDGSPPEILVDSLNIANARVSSTSQRDPQLRGMGSTIECIGIADGRFLVRRVGDSRTYVLAKDGLRRVGRDMTLTEYLVDTGQATAEDVATDPRRSQLTAYAGMGKPFDDVVKKHGVHNFKLDDVSGFVVCSDGLTNEVSEAELAQALSEDLHPGAIARSLVDKAKRAGGRDNITVVVGKIVPQGYQPKSPGAPADKKKPLGRKLAILVVALAVLGVGIAGPMLIEKRTEPAPTTPAPAPDWYDARMAAVKKLRQQWERQESEPRRPDAMTSVQADMVSLPGLVEKGQWDEVLARLAAAERIYDVELGHLRHLAEVATGHVDDLRKQLETARGAIARRTDALTVALRPRTELAVDATRARAAWDAGHFSKATTLYLDLEQQFTKALAILGEVREVLELWDKVRGEVAAVTEGKNALYAHPAAMLAAVPGKSRRLEGLTAAILSVRRALAKNVKLVARRDEVVKAWPGKMKSHGARAALQTAAKRLAEGDTDLMDGDWAAARESYDATAAAFVTANAREAEHLASAKRTADFAAALAQAREHRAAKKWAAAGAAILRALAIQRSDEAVAEAGALVDAIVVAPDRKSAGIARDVLRVLAPTDRRLPLLEAFANGQPLRVPDKVYTTIQAALDAALPGQWIRIKDGEYNGGLKITKPVRLTGSALVRAGSAPSALLIERCKSVVVEGLRFEGGVACVTVDKAVVELRGITVTKAKEPGLRVKAGANVLVDNSKFRGNGGVGVSVRAGGAGRLHNNDMDDNGSHGAMFSPGSAGRAVNNRCTDNSGSGVFIRGAHPGVLLERNRCKHNKRFGIAISGANTAVLLRRNDCRGNAKGGFSFQNGAPRPKTFEQDGNVEE